MGLPEADCHCYCRYRVCALPGRAPPEHSNRLPGTSRRSRWTTTRRIRWSSTSPRTGASSTSSVTAADDLEAEHAADRDRGHGPRHAQPGERPARPAARAGLRVQQVGLPLLLAAAGQHQHAGRRALQGQRRHARPELRAEHPDLPAPDAGSAATRPARCTSARTAASSSRRATTRTRSTRAASTRSTSAPAASAWDAQRTSANTNDLNGKILRIKPMEIPTGTPGVGTTYTIPAGNLFAPRAPTKDPARDLRHGLPQPVPLHGRPGDGLGAERRLRP